MKEYLLALSETPNQFFEEIINTKGLLLKYYDEFSITFDINNLFKDKTLDIYVFNSAKENIVSRYNELNLENKKIIKQYLKTVAINVNYDSEEKTLFNLISAEDIGEGDFNHYKFSFLNEPVIFKEDFQSTLIENMVDDVFADQIVNLDLICTIFTEKNKELLSNLLEDLKKQERERDEESDFNSASYDDEEYDDGNYNHSYDVISLEVSNFKNENKKLIDKLDKFHYTIYDSTYLFLKDNTSLLKSMVELHNIETEKKPLNKKIALDIKNVLNHSYDDEYKPFIQQEKESPPVLNQSFKRIKETNNLMSLIKEGFEDFKDFSLYKILSNEDVLNIVNNNVLITKSVEDLVIQNQKLFENSEYSRSAKKISGKFIFLLQFHRKMESLKEEIEELGGNEAGEKELNEFVQEYEQMNSDLDKKIKVLLEERHQHSLTSNDELKKSVENKIASLMIGELNELKASFVKEDIKDFYNQSLETIKKAEEIRFKVKLLNLIEYKTLKNDEKELVKNMIIDCEESMQKLMLDNIHNPFVNSLDIVFTSFTLINQTRTVFDSDPDLELKEIYMSFIDKSKLCFNPVEGVFRTENTLDIKSILYETANLNSSMHYLTLEEAAEKGFKYRFVNGDFSSYSREPFVEELKEYSKKNNLNKVFESLLSNKNIGHSNNGYVMKMISELNKIDFNINLLGKTKSNRVINAENLFREFIGVKYQYPEYISWEKYLTIMENKEYFRGNMVYKLFLDRDILSKEKFEEFMHNRFVLAEDFQGDNKSINGNIFLRSLQLLINGEKPIFNVDLIKNFEKIYFNNNISINKVMIVDMLNVIFEESEWMNIPDFKVYWSKITGGFLNAVTEMGSGKFEILKPAVQLCVNYTKINPSEFHKVLNQISREWTFDKDNNCIVFNNKNLPILPNSNLHQDLISIFKNEAGKMLENDVNKLISFLINKKMSYSNNMLLRDFFIEEAKPILLDLVREVGPNKIHALIQKDTSYVLNELGRFLIKEGYDNFDFDTFEELGYLRTDYDESNHKFKSNLEQFKFLTSQCEDYKRNPEKFEKLIYDRFMSENYIKIPYVFQKLLNEKETTSLLELLKSGTALLNIEKMKSDGEIFENVIGVQDNKLLIPDFLVGHKAEVDFMEQLINKYSLDKEKVSSLDSLNSYLEYKFIDGKEEILKDVGEFLKRQIEIGNKFLFKDLSALMYAENSISDKRISKYIIDSLQGENNVAMREIINVLSKSKNNKGYSLTIKDSSGTVSVLNSNDVITEAFKNSFENKKYLLLNYNRLFNEAFKTDFAFKDDEFNGLVNESVGRKSLTNILEYIETHYQYSKDLPYSLFNRETNYDEIEKVFDKILGFLSEEEQDILLRNLYSVKYNEYGTQKSAFEGIEFSKENILEEIIDVTNKTMLRNAFADIVETSLISSSKFKEYFANISDIIYGNEVIKNDIVQSILVTKSNLEKDLTNYKKKIPITEEVKVELAREIVKLLKDKSETEPPRLLASSLRQLFGVDDNLILYRKNYNAINEYNAFKEKAGIDYLIGDIALRKGLIHYCVDNKMISDFHGDLIDLPNQESLSELYSRYVQAEFVDLNEIVNAASSKFLKNTNNVNSLVFACIGNFSYARVGFNNGREVMSKSRMDLSSFPEEYFMKIKSFESECDNKILTQLIEGNNPVLSIVNSINSNWINSLPAHEVYMDKIKDLSINDLIFDLDYRIIQLIDNTNMITVSNMLIQKVKDLIEIQDNVDAKSFISNFNALEKIRNMSIYHLTNIASNNDIIDGLYSEVNNQLLFVKTLFHNLCSDNKNIKEDLDNLSREYDLSEKMKVQNKHKASIKKKKL